MATGAITSIPVSEEFCPPECLPNYDNLVTEDEKPVDNLYSERQHRLLTVPLIDSWKGPEEGCPRIIASDVGLFNSDVAPGLAPDVLLTLGVAPPQSDLSRKDNRSYYVWKYGRPDALIEVVSNTEGGELTKKLLGYARIGAVYYIVWDPFQFLGEKQLHCFALERGKYVPCEPWFPELGLGVKTWDGMYADIPAIYLRWCDRHGNFIPTGAERAEKLAEKLRALGVDPDQP